MFYVYIHTRNDTGEIFYVGKGQRRRAYSVRNRNAHWKRIVNLYGRTVRIHSEFSDEPSAFECESRLIQEFKESGYSLVNLTDGGEGCSGRQLSEKEKLRVSEVHKGKTLTQKHHAQLMAGVIGRPSHRRGKPFPAKAKYSDETLLQIEQTPGTNSFIAQKYGCSRSLVSKLKKHITHTYLWIDHV